MIEERKLTFSVWPQFQCACARLLLEVDKIFMKHDKTLMDSTMDHADRSGKWSTKMFYTGHQRDQIMSVAFFYIKVWILFLFLLLGMSIAHLLDHFLIPILY